MFVKRILQSVRELTTRQFDVSIGKSNSSTFWQKIVIELSFWSTNDTELTVR